MPNIFVTCPSNIPVSSNRHVTCFNVPCFAGCCAPAIRPSVIPNIVAAANFDLIVHSPFASPHPPPLADLRTLPSSVDGSDTKPFSLDDPKARGRSRLSALLLVKNHHRLIDKNSNQPASESTLMFEP